MRKQTLYRALLTISMAMILNSALAQGGSIVAKGILDGGLFQLKADSSRTVEDTAFFNPGNIGILDTGYRVQNVITLKINEATPLYLRTDFTVNVHTRLYYSNGTDEDSIDHTFTVNYDSAGTYNARNNFVFYGGRRVTVKVLSIDSLGATWPVTTVLMLENQLTCSPNFVLDCSHTVSDITVTPSEEPNADELPVTWTTVTGADVYDLEWTYIDSTALANNKYGSPINSSLIFYHNATRITTSATSYNIPLIYDNTGKLFIRVRAVQSKPANAVLNAVWSSDVSPAILGEYEFTGHERNLNWQSNISFAEEGKRKVVVQYFDGSLRSRQTVTKDNTTNKTIIAETYYDYQGRPAIQVMPAPSLGNIIQYTASFNVSINGAEYTQSNYDTLVNPGLYCSTRADSMSTLSGASQYYSPNNPNKMIGMNQFIPDAKRYPFSETEYTQDNTGRISRQGGVGPDHQLGTGHETKYFYDRPDQNELDALFGTEVGDKSHYFKNMIRDANGQYSISYVDMHGRTIATALAGNAPPGIAPLASNNTVEVTESLADSGSMFVQGLSIIHQKSFTVPVPGDYEFNYSLSPQSFTELNCDSVEICYTCLYDLQITITDNCNNQLLPGGEPYDTVIHNFSFGSIPAGCSDSALRVHFTLNLAEGNYMVTKKLTVNKDAYVYYRDSVYLPNNTCVSLEEFVEEQRQIIANLNTQCFADCGTCRDSLGTFEDFRVQFITEAGISVDDSASYHNEILTAYNNALTACDVLCNDSLSDDVDIRNAMLQDMTPPYGQYADTLKATQGDKYSVFYIKPSEDGSFIPVFKLDDVEYKDANGNPDSVYNLESDLMVLPGTLSMSQFVQSFRSSWAEALLPYHPEYCKLLVMESHRSSNIWDRRMEAVDNFRDARDQGFLNPTGNGSYPFPVVSANIDPFAATPSLKNALEDKLEEYLRAVPLAGNPALSMWGMANMMARCDSGVADCVDFYAIPANVFDTTVLCDGDLDMAWRNFRQLYLGVKQQLLYNLINNPTGCTPSNPLFTSVPKNTDIFSAGHTPQFSNDITTTLDQNGLTAINQAGGNPNHLGQATAQSQQKLDSFYTENCRAYVQQWTLRLQPCAYDPELLADTLLPRLLALCRMACDVDHPFGASTLPAGVTYTPAGTDYVFTSFNNIIDAFNALHPPTPGVVDCNAELITEPEPYDKQPVYSEKPIFTKPSDCECTLINDLYNTYLLANQGDASFAAYLQRTQQITMSNADLNTLRNMCNNSDVNGPGTAACVWLPQPIFLPASMQCNTGQVCASCTLVDSLYQDYMEAYPDQVPEIGELEDTTQTKINTLFSNYMNNRLGFGMQAWEYLQFMAACDSSEIVDTVNCIDRPVGNLFLFSGTGSLSDIQSTSDDGFILAGVTSGSGAGGEDGIIIKTNGTGMVQWTKAYGGTGGDNFTRVKATSDNGYIAVGTTRSGRYPQGEMLIVKFNSSGATEWTRNIGFNTIFGERGYDIIETSGGGYAALGIYDQHTGNGEFMVAKLDGGGDLEWVRRFGTSRLQPDTCTPFGPDSLTFTATPAYGLVQRGDTLVIAGTAYDSNLGNRYFGVIYQVSAFDGELIRNWHYADISNNEKSTWFRDIHATDDGYTVLVNNANHYSTDSLQAAVVKLSYSGEVVDYKRFNLPSGSNKITSSGMYPTSDGGYLLAQTGNNDPHIFWQRVDAEGMIQFETESAIPGDQLLGRLIQNDNNSFTAVGVNNGNKPLLVDLFPTTPTGCYDNTVTIGLTSPVLSRINWALEGSEFMVPVYTDTTLIATVISTSDSSLICPGNGNCYTVYEGPRLCGKSQPIFPPLAIDSTTICSDSTFFAVSKGTELSKVYKDSLTGSFEKRYNEVCLNAYRYESFTMTHNKAEYHYTIYYYDQAGNLVRTVPPAGVNPNHDSTWLASVRAARAEGSVVVPGHTMATGYRYNTLNQEVAQNSPDAGLAHFWYDNLGRLVISQNAKQEDSAHYSYTKYDTIGRIIEVGQLENAVAMADPISRIQSDLADWINNAYATAEQITKTKFDYKYAPLEPVMAAKNLRNRVSWTALFRTAEDVENDSAATATYFSYDILGNVDTLVQDYRFGVMAENGNRFKKMVHEYDLVSGKVNRVAYQPGLPDAFYHVYFYDAENRITHGQTSADSINWDNEAFYTYYDHGPLARTILGDQQVQGINYSYTLQGWLKSINPAVHTSEGYTLLTDGSNGSVVAKNAYDILLNYFDNDYAAISGASSPQAGLADALGLGNHRPLFNGNISNMGVNIFALTHTLLYNYQYDQLNRLIKMDAWERTNGAWSNIALRSDFQERISYDPNGNISQYKRNGNNTFVGDPIGMDSLSYKYIKGTNRLDHVKDSAPLGNYSVDIDDQDMGNYIYDAIGNMISDNAEGIDSISWTIYGKIAAISKSNGINISYTYDAAGNRISKTVSQVDTTITTWYVRDGQGNVMGVYTAGNDSINNGDLTQTELNLYGSGRVGIFRCSTNVQNLAPVCDTSLPLIGQGYIVKFMRGNKLFELNNHLGNVLVTVSDKKSGISGDDSTVDYYNPDVVSAQDYYPGGLQMPGRSFNSSTYRYGFQNQEVDKELWGGAINFNYRVEDPRLNRFFSVDPLASSFPWNSPYAFSENRLIDGREMEGLEVVLVNKQKDAAIYNVGINNKDKSAVHIYAHSTPSNIDMGGGNWSHNAQDFQAVLQKSDVYNNAKSTEKVVVVLHSCRAGRSYFDENGNYVPSVAEQLSSAFPNITIIAPDERDNFSSDGKREIGPKQIKYPMNKRADYTPGQPEESSSVFGNWNVFQGGKWVGQYDAGYDASTAPTWWDNKFNYHNVNISITGTVTANKLNIRSSAGFGNNKIGSLNKGATISLTGNVNGSWSEISLEGGGTGWISTSHIKQNVIVNIDDQKKK